MLTRPPGDPEGLRAAAARFLLVAEEYDGLALNINNLPGSIDGWSGIASDAFRTRCSGLSAVYRGSGLAFEAARDALNTYASKLDAAQSRADHALSSANTAQFAIKALIASTPAGKLPNLGDYEHALSDANNDLFAAWDDALLAALACAARLSEVAAMAHNPAHAVAQAHSEGEHHWWDGPVGFIGSAYQGVADYWSRQNPVDFAKDFIGGVGDAGAGLVKVVVSTAELPVKLITHPIDTVEHGIKIVGYVVTHPAEVGSALIDLKDWENGHPGRALGQILPNIALLFVGGGELTAVNEARNAATVAEEVAAAARLSVAERIGILRDAAAGKGNFGLGTAMRADADALGKAWVGDGYRVASDGKTLVSKDGLRIYRPPSYKGKLGKYQANFEYRYSETGRPISNGHLDVSDMP